MGGLGFSAFAAPAGPECPRSGLRSTLRAPLRPPLRHSGPADAAKAKKLKPTIFQNRFIIQKKKYQPKRIYQPTETRLSL